MRTIASPRAALVISVDTDAPGDWPTSDGAPEGNLGHALGWTVEVRRNDIVLLNPLGEGLVKVAVPELDTAWLENVRHDGSCAVFLAPANAESGFAELTLSSAASVGDIPAATVRAAITDDFGAKPQVGRNQPCPCGSGKKFKHCHG